MCCFTVMKNFNNRTKSIAILFDFQKNFDVLNRYILLYKLYAYGTREERSQVVNIIKEVKALSNDVNVCATG